MIWIHNDEREGSSYSTGQVDSDCWNKSVPSVCGIHGRIVGCPCSTLRDNSCSKAQHYRFSVRFNIGGFWDATARALWEEPQPLTAWLYGWGDILFMSPLRFYVLSHPFLSRDERAADDGWAAQGKWENRSEEPFCWKGGSQEITSSRFGNSSSAYGTIPKRWCFFSFLFW